MIAMHKVLSWVILFLVLITYQNESLEGTWIAESDSKSKWVFTNDGKCKRYYDNELLNTYVYSLSNKSPQCDKTVPINSKTQYLKLVKVGKVDSEYCYEVNGITSEKLSLRQMGRGGLLLFDKQ